MKLEEEINSDILIKDNDYPIYFIKTSEGGALEQ